MKKVCFITAIMLCVFLVAIIVKNSYALLETKGTFVVNEDVGAWVIKINNNSITSENLEFTIDSFTWSSDSNVKPGSFAPGITGSFRLLLDPTGTDVSVRYDINFDLEELKRNHIVVTSVRELNGNELTLTGENLFTGVIPLSDINNGVTHDIVVNVNWVGDKDVEDTELGMSDDNELALPIELNITQYLGEPIVEYVVEDETE